MKRAFTLLEVNLAMFIMAGGVLSMCVLYALGFRENRQSVEDVAATAYADAYLAPLVQGLSATNVTWSAWKGLGGGTDNDDGGLEVDGREPANGWRDYIEERTDGRKHTYRVIGSPKAKAQEVFGKVARICRNSPSAPDLPDGYQCALVATRHGPMIQLAFRIAQRKESLMSQPLFVSEVRFQGDPEQ